MVYQIGIYVMEELKEFFVKVWVGFVWFIKVVIEDEQFVLGVLQELVGCWDQDYDRVVLLLLDVQQFCYLFYCFDLQNVQGFEWFFFVWLFDNFFVWLKMLYVVIWVIVKKEFGGGYIKDEFFGIVKDDFFFVGYQKYLLFCVVFVLLILVEREFQQICINEVKIEISVESKYQILQGFVFFLQFEV